MPQLPAVDHHSRTSKTGRPARPDKHRNVARRRVTQGLHQTPTCRIKTAALISQILKPGPAVRSGSRKMATSCACRLSKARDIAPFSRRLRRHRSVADYPDRRVQTKQQGSCRAAAAAAAGAATAPQRRGETDYQLGAPLRPHSVTSLKQYWRTRSDGSSCVTTSR